MSYLSEFLPAMWGDIQDRNRLIEVMQQCIKAMKDHGDLDRAQRWEEKITRLPKNMTKQSIDGHLQIACLETGILKYS
jgi:hypothetical protein